MDTDDEEVALSESKFDGICDPDSDAFATKILPKRPGACRARAGDGKATIWWSEESKEEEDLDTDDQGFSKTEAYVVYKYRFDGGEWVEKGASERPSVKFPNTSTTVEGLINGREYAFSVRARNRKGVMSKESVRSNSIKPFQPLPEPWTEHFDKASGKIYYYDPETKQRTWNRPVENVYRVSEENLQRFQKKEITKMRVCFSEVDENDSGQIDENELVELFKELDIAISRPKARKIMKKIDVDGSGVLEFDEFLTMMYKFRRGELDGFTDQVGKLFNGSLVKVAAGSVLGKLKNKIGDSKHVETMHELHVLEKARMGNWVCKYDEARRRKYYVNKVTQDKVWKLPDEVMWFVPEKLSFEFTDEQLAQFKEQFQRFDEDRSGEMDVDELTEAIRMLGDNIPHQAVLKLIKEVDVDNSGEINFAEFVHIMFKRKQANQNTGILGKIIKPTTETNRKSPAVIAHGKIQAAQKAERKAAQELENVRTELLEVKQENQYLRKKVEKLRRSGGVGSKGVRTTVFIKVIPVDEFLESLRLTQYLEKLQRYGVRDTSDLFRLEDADYDDELAFKLGHKRKLQMALKRLEEQ